MSTPDGEPGRRARQVCANCKARKRGCDKAIPQCSHCVRKRLECKYAETDQIRSPAPQVDQSSYEPLADAHDAPAECIDYATVLFMDPDLLQHGHPDTPLATVKVPSQVLDHLGDVDELCLASGKYFVRTHPWMPIISKKRFYDLYIHQSPSAHPDLALLFLAQKLITTPPPASPYSARTPLYQVTKRWHSHLEVSSVLSLPMLQAQVLLALYAYALGLNVKAVSYRRATTMVEVEERRRVWWAIVILDRFVNIGCPGRPFAIPEPSRDELLPADDAKWDNGIVQSADLATLSTPLTSHMSKFALLCQAARLLGQVLIHIADGSESSDDDVGLQLDRTLHSMLSAALNVEVPDYDQITFIFSALVALNTPTFRLAGTSVPRTSFSPDRMSRALAVCKLVTERFHIPNFTESRCPLTSRPPEEMSVWGCFFAYQVCAVYMRVKQKNNGEEEVVKFFKEAFKVIDRGWRAAGIYLRLLEAQEAMKCA
ncbi:uncharacterized protein CC84DRAFT_312207 [Paraphaeosphaeria sporulosa]|uniref:Zn(2)-C6 fungal-type domain-containing protein n=1 Tax=Paraphaeosphaeria sporulosa TaxID=1460663 RepID=A0A177C0Z0_9PLEO|nr:uncharacterized protein CC84DRAFT_312207 [Paraphaeosphaeria sporulosa]OAG00549.1 hypothetical protein CC84DRAFT_312207 [Paraphaeosphaeria sporulosa]